jgi:N-acetylmuramoyl-L-alanine amidase
MLTGVSMPAVLSENGFFTNYSDAGLMIDVNWQQSIAKAHAKGILDYAVQQGVVWE